MRTKEEIEEAFGKIGTFLEQEDFEDDETLQGMYEMLKWFSGYDWVSTVAGYLPDN